MSPSSEESKTLYLFGGGKGGERGGEGEGKGRGRGNLKKKRVSLSGLWFKENDRVLERDFKWWRGKEWGLKEWCGE